MNNKVVTLGEILLRLSPPENQRIINSDYFDVHYGGAEINVAVNLAILGMSTKVVTKVPDNQLGNAAIRHLNSFGVDSSEIIKGEERIGTYFLEKGMSIRNSKVIYDRKDSAFSLSNVSEYDIENILKGAKLFHVSGITLALGKNTYEIAKAFMKKAKEMSITVSFDFNYRSKLWTLEEASLGIKDVLKYVDIAFAGYLDFVNILNYECQVEYNEDNLIKIYETLYPKVMRDYGFQYIVSSYRKTSSASENEYTGFLYNGEKIVCSKNYKVNIIDRVGSGDSFTSGFLFGYLNEKDDKYKIEFATGSGAIKHTILGDINLISQKEIENLFKDNSFDVGR